MSWPRSFFSEEYNLQVAEAQAALQSAEALLEDAEAGSRKESIRQAEAQVKQAQPTVTDLEQQLSMLEGQMGQTREELAATFPRTWLEKHACWQNILSVNELKRESFAPFPPKPLPMPFFP